MSESLNSHGNGGCEFSFSGCSVTKVATTTDIATAMTTPSSITRIRYDLLLLDPLVDLTDNKETQNEFFYEFIQIETCVEKGKLPFCVGNSVQLTNSTSSFLVSSLRSPQLITVTLPGWRRVEFT